MERRARCQTETTRVQTFSGRRKKLDAGKLSLDRGRQAASIYIYIYIYIYISGGPLSALTCCVNVRLLSGDKKNIAVNLFSKLGWELGLYYASYDDFHPDILAQMYT